MADTKISALTAVATPAGTDEFGVNQAGTSKKLTLAQIEAYLEGRGLPIVTRLSADHSVSSATATEVTGLSVTLAPGTYNFTYNLICQTTATGTGLGFALNYTGTVTRMAYAMRYVSTGAAAATGVVEDAIATLTGNIVEGSSSRSEGTTTATLGPFTGAAAANADFLIIIEGTIVVSDAGDLELWHASEGAVATTVESDSSVSLVRTA